MKFGKSSEMNATHSSLQQTPIAIIGMASIFPQARNLQQYWDNIIREVDCITDVPPSRWNIEDYYDPDPNKPDKTYCKRGGFIPDIDFEPLEFGLPPNILEATDISQLLALVTAKEALEDAGYDKAQDTLLEQTGITLGVAVGRQLGTPLGARMQYPIWERVLKNSGLSDKDTQHIVERIKAAYVGWQENSFPGALGNVVAGRVANRLNLGGTNCVVDAACASSLGAVKMAISELVERRCDMMITGGIDTDNSIMMYMCFSKTPAFSQKENTRPFDADSDGMLIGEGIGMLVLKRLEDAERDHDKIYAIIRGIGTSSDGRYKSIYAPRPEGQMKALRRAYQDAGFSPATVGLIEAHGTGTMAGDPAEVEALKEVFGENNPKKQYIALGSVKSQIGHTKAAAGAASLIKAALALHHKVLPPTINITQPNPALELETSPFYLNTKARPWFRVKEDPPRRAGVSSFGFGGTNFHVVLEEYAGPPPGPPEGGVGRRLQTVPEPVLLSAQTPAQLLAQCQDVLTRLQTDAGQEYYRELLAASKSQTSSTPHTPLAPTSSPPLGGAEGGPGTGGHIAAIPVAWARVGFVVESLAEACEFLQMTIDTLKSSYHEESWTHPRGIYYRRDGIIPEGKVVALFSGQGSQYLEMGRELACNLPLLREVYSDMDALFIEDGWQPVSSVVFPPPAFNQAEREAQAEVLRRTEYAQPAIGAFSAGLYKIMQQAGFKPDFVAGHSFGELTALWAAGVLADKDYFALVKARGKAMASPDDPDFDAGAMLAVKGDIGQIQAEVAGFSAPRSGGGSDIAVANLNANNQAVLAGPTPTVKKVQQFLVDKGYSAVLLPVSAAFHTPLVDHAQQPFSQAIEAVTFNSPKISVYANATGSLYPSDPKAIQDTLAEHILKPVLFKQQIENIYQAGGFCFIEFGPKNILTNLVKNILNDKPHVAVALNANSKKDSDRQLREALVQLRVIGLPLGDLDPASGTFQSYLASGNNSKVEDALSSSPPLATEGRNEGGPGAWGVAKKTSLKVRLNGNNYISEKTKMTMEKALQDRYQITPSTPPAGEQGSRGAEEQGSRGAREQENFTPAPLHPSTPAPLHNPGLDYQHILDNLERGLTQFTQDQHETVRVHEQYLNNQSEYAKIFFQLMQQQYDILSKGNATPEQMETMRAILESLGHSMLRFHDHQGETGRIHEEYLNNQAEYFKSFFQLLQQQYALFIPHTSLWEAGGGQAQATGSTVPQNPGLTPAAPTHTPTPPPPHPPLEDALSSSPPLATEGRNEGGPGADRQQDGSVTSPPFGDVAAPAKPVAVPDSAAPVFRAGPNSNSNQAEVTPAASTHTPTPPHPLPPEPPAIPSGEIGVNEITTTLLEVVSDKTGYPIEVLEPEMDMEADLGIDSIKRVEILGAIQELFPDLPQVNPEELGELRTLGQIIDFIKVNIPANTPDTPHPPLEDALPEMPPSAPTPPHSPPPQSPPSSPPLGGTEGGPGAGGNPNPVSETPTPVTMSAPAFDVEQGSQDSVANSRLNSSRLNSPTEKLTTDQLATNLSALLLEVVSDRTGYPIEVLELEMDMEADLGIDRVKRVEILGAVRDSLPGFPFGDALVSNFKPEVLSELRTLGQIIDFIKVNIPANAPDTPHPHTPTPPHSLPPLGGRGGEVRAEDRETPAPAHNINRYLVSLKPLPEPDFLDFTLAEDHICLLTDDGSPMTINVAQTLSSRGWTVVVLSFPSSIVANTPHPHTPTPPHSLPPLGGREGPHPGGQLRLPEGVKQIVLEDMSEEHLKKQLSDISKAYGQVGVFIHLNPSSPVAPNEGLRFLEAEKAIVKHVFLMAKHLKNPLNEAALQGRSCFLTVARLDGQFGLGSSEMPSLPPSLWRPKEGTRGGQVNFGVIGASLFGLTKTLNLEWPSVFCRAIDLSLELDTAGAVSSIIAELHDPNNDLVEVGYSSQGRATLVCRRCPLEDALRGTGYQKTPPPLHPRSPAPLHRIDRSSVFLVSGGAKGITAECIIKLAQHYQCKFILLGRSSIAEPEPAWARDCFDEAELKKRIMADLNSRQGPEHPGKPTPLSVQSAFKAIISKREIEKTLQAIEQAGGQAAYLSLDITDSSALQEKLADAVQSMGPITGIIHGAGNIADKWIEKKTEADFEIVYATKVKGLENLLQCVPVDQLDHLVLFSSTAAFYGNIGQADYAMANEVLNKAAHLIKQQRPSCHVVSINWGPWDGGMVTPALKKIFAMQNIEVIPIELGTHMFLEELSTPHPPLGPQAGAGGGPQVVINSPITPPTLSPEVGKPAAKLPAFRIHRKVTVEANPFLADHMIGDQPVLPFTCAASWIINTSEYLNPGYKFFAWRDLKVLKGIIPNEIPGGELVLDLKEIARTHAGVIELEATIWSENTSGKVCYHYQGQISLLWRVPAAPTYTPTPPSVPPSGGEPAGAKPGLALYQDGTLFHGPCFQGVDRVLNLTPESLTMQCLLPEVEAGKQGQFPARLFNPYIVDAQLHSVLIWTQHFYQEGCLPSKLSHFEQFAPIPFGQPFYVSLEVQTKTKTAVVVNIIAHDAQGQVYNRLLRGEFTVSKGLNERFKQAAETQL